MIHKAAFAGSFYPGEAPELRRQLASAIPPRHRKRKALAVMLPHAGYRYCGHIIGKTLAGLVLPRRFVLLCPNHTGRGAPLSLQSLGRWQTPLGEVEIDRPLARAIKHHCLNVQDSPEALRLEHSVEVQLPFLQYFLDEFSFVPLAVGTSRLQSLLQLGRGLAAVLEEAEEPVMLIATSDLNHFEPAEVGRRKDKAALRLICDMDCQGLYREVRERPISMCGYGPVIATMHACSLLEAQGAEVVDYAQSSDVTGEFSSVVGYAGVVIH